MCRISGVETGIIRSCRLNSSDLREVGVFWSEDDVQAES